MKTCIKCSQTKQLSDYYKYNQRYYSSYCKECQNSYVKNNPHTPTRQRARSNNDISVLSAIRLSDREYQRRRRAQNPQWKARQTLEYYHKNKEKIKAHRLIHKQLMTGQMKKLPCQICNASTHIQGHHPDYSKPLEVVWLCPSHHKLEHLSIS